MRYLFLLLLAGMLLLTGPLMAQATLSLEPRLGYGAFQMKYMKEYQQTIIKNSEVNAKATDTFAPYYQFGLNAVYALSDKGSIGMFVEQGSTGGRVHYEDYSGELRHDLFVQYKTLGFMAFAQNPMGDSPFSFLTGIEANVFFSRLKEEKYYLVYTVTDATEKKYNATGFGLKPYAGLQYHILTLPFRLTVGYLVSGSGPFHVPGEPDHFLVRNSKREKLAPDWSGFRISLSVSVPILHNGSSSTTANPSNLLKRKPFTLILPSLSGM